VMAVFAVLPTLLAGFILAWWVGQRLAESSPRSIREGRTWRRAWRWAAVRYRSSDTTGGRTHPPRR
jgi:hypothetical protein